MGKQPSKPDAAGRSGPIRVGLAGNPNAGKSTIFNHLTGSRQHVGNYPGVTVETKEGRFRYQDREIQVIDLPGTYSLTAYSLEELVARRFVIEDRPDVIVDVIDASNLERNLYLAVQFMELGIPLILAFNMSDVAKARGTEIDIELLSELLGVTIIPTVGHRGRGMDELKEAILATALAPADHRPSPVTYGDEVERQVNQVARLIEDDGGLDPVIPARWLAVKLLEEDEEAEKQLAGLSHPDEISEAVKKAAHHIETDFGDSAETLIADRRYGFISGACQEAVRSTVESRHSMSDRIDSVVTSRVLGIPIFLGVMYVVFALVFTLGEVPMDWIEHGVEDAAELVAGWWPAGTESALRSLLVNGIIGGVGGILVFLPNIFLLFLAIAVLEDSGYMARAAFIMDRLMHKIGLHGRSFIPMLIGFGCTVPAVMGTRTLESRRDRLGTMLVLPLMSCGARLPIYMLFIPAFFPQAWQAPILWSLYLIGIVLAILLAKLLRSTILKGETAPFVMELPPYRMPTIKGTLMHMWERGWMFIRKAGTVIVGISILLWAMMYYPRAPQPEAAPDHDHAAVAPAGCDEHDILLQTAHLGDFAAAGPGQLLPGPAMVDSGSPLGLPPMLAHAPHPGEGIGSEQLRYSIAGRLGHGIEPVMSLIGFDWKTSVAMIGAFAAKEVFVAQLAIVHAIETEGHHGHGHHHDLDDHGHDHHNDRESLREGLQHEYSALQAFCIMLFSLLSMPCMVTVVTVWKESGSWKWAALQLVGLTVIAYVITFAVYQIGQLFV